MVLIDAQKLRRRPDHVRKSRASRSSARSIRASWCLFPGRTFELLAPSES
ncbi:MAG: hypothetical protein ACLR8Y_08895 [Alistipes indistinctus]